MYDAEDILGLLNYHDQDFTCSHFLQIRKQSTLEEAEEAKAPEPEHKERTMTVLKLTEGLGVILGH
jgi:hypothetical protein